VDIKSELSELSKSYSPVIARLAQDKFLEYANFLLNKNETESALSLLVEEMTAQELVAHKVALVKMTQELANSRVAEKEAINTVLSIALKLALTAALA